MTCDQCHETFYFSREYQKNLPCWKSNSKLKLYEQLQIL